MPDMFYDTPEIKGVLLHQNNIHCGCCCSVCLDHGNWDGYSFLNELIPEYDYIRKYFEKSHIVHNRYVRAKICLTCLSDIEHNFIDDMSLKDIPLYLNHYWFSMLSEEYMLNKLKG